MAETSSIDNGLFNLSDKKIKKRSLQSSLSTSSSLSSNSTHDIQIGSSSVCADSSSKFYGENKENVTYHVLDKDEMPASLFQITFKFLNTETRLLRKILLKHGLSEAAHDATDYNLLWTGNVLKPDLLRNLSSYQRINHFPR